MATLVDKRILRRSEVVSLVGLSQSTIYRMISRGEFPRPMQLGRRATGWSADEVEEWLTSRSHTTPESPGLATGRVLRKKAGDP